MQQVINSLRFNWPLGRKNAAPTTFLSFSAVLEIIYFQVIVPVEVVTGLSFIPLRQSLVQRWVKDIQPVHMFACCIYSSLFFLLLLIKSPKSSCRQSCFLHSFLPSPFPASKHTVRETRDIHVSDGWFFWLFLIYQSCNPSDLSTWIFKWESTEKGREAHERKQRFRKMIELSLSPDERSVGDLILRIQGIGMLNFCLLETYLLPKPFK